MTSKSNVQSSQDTRRLTRTAARREQGYGPFALIQHVGRKSGTAYETPIIVGVADDSFVAELTYGPNVDWVKNLQAASGGAVVWRGKPYAINHVEPLDAKSGAAAFPVPIRFILPLLPAPITLS